jgi:hypothetical protein
MTGEGTGRGQKSEADFNENVLPRGDKVIMDRPVVEPAIL